MSSNEQDIKHFLDIKIVNNASDKTIDQQQIILRQFDEFLRSKPFRTTIEEDVLSFLSHRREHGVSPSSLYVYKIVIKGFYRFLYGLPPRQYPNQVRNLNGGKTKRKVPIRPEDIITKEDIADLVKHCMNYRDEALVVTLYESGCRIDEFLNTNIEHLNFDERGIVLIVSGKTGQRRIRLIESVPYLQKWIENHPLGDDNGSKPLWCSVMKPHQRITPSLVRILLKRLKKRSGINKPLNPHSFRHSRLTELAKYLSDAKLKIFAGWTPNSNMAGVYVHLSGHDLDEDLLKVAGVKIEEEKPKVSPLRIKECERCHAQNPGTAEFCHTCGMPFNKQLLVTQTLEYEGLKEELQVATDVMESMWNARARVGIPKGADAPAPKKKTMSEDLGEDI